MDDKIDFNDFLTPDESRARYKKNKQMLGFGWYWAVPIEGKTAINVLDPILTTAEQLRKTPKAFKDMEVFPAYRKDLNYDE